MAGRFHFLVSNDEIGGNDPATSARITLGQLRDRIAVLIEQGIPLDARVVTLENDVWGRTEIGFERPEDLTLVATEELLDRLCGPTTSPDNRTLIRAEILARISQQAAQ